MPPKLTSKSRHRHSRRNFALSRRIPDLVVKALGHRARAVFRAALDVSHDAPTPNVDMALRTLQDRGIAVVTVDAIALACQMDDDPDETPNADPDETRIARAEAWLTEPANRQAVETRMASKIYPVIVEAAEQACAADTD